MDRNEIAVSCYAALLGRHGMASPTSALIAQAFEAADAFLAASRPALTSPASYVPKVGDVVHGLYFDDTLARITHVDPGGLTGRATGLASWCVIPDSFVGFPSRLRPATPEERKAAGLDAAPASPPAVDREGLALRARVAEAVFNAFDLKKSGDERAHAVYLAALEAVGYDKSWAGRSVGSFIEHLKGGAS